MGVVRDPATARVVRERAAAAVAAELAAEADELAALVTDRAREETPELMRGDDEWKALAAAGAAGLRNMSDMLARHADPREIELPQATRAVARQSARQGVPMPSLMRFYRLALDRIVHTVLDTLARETTSHEELHAAADYCSSWLLAYLDVAQQHAESAYLAEREQWIRSAAASRTETIEAILAGRETDTRHASQRLRHELDGWHVAAVAWVDGAREEDASARLEAAVGAIAGVLPGTLLSHPLGLLALSAWISRPGPFAPSELAALAVDPEAAPGVRVALGRPDRGLAGFRASHLQALNARRVATLAGRPASSVTAYGDVALESMATVDAEQARAMVATVLGPLADDDEPTRRIAETVCIYLDENASRTRAAQRLGIHKNTVTYRVNRAEELLGHAIDQDRLDLHVALRLLAMVR